MNGNRNDASALLGALAGAAGGLPVALVMTEVAPRLPEAIRPREIPPKMAVEWAERQAGRPEALDDEAEMRWAMAVHFAYSALTGAAYGLARQRMRRLPAPLSGALFGLTVWAASFEGWMPALGIMERTTEKPVSKWPMPLMMHLMYGVGTALAFEGLEGMRRRRRGSFARRQEPQPRRYPGARQPTLEGRRPHKAATLPEGRGWAGGAAALLAALLAAVIRLALG